jgi:hypothetical protein
VFAAAINVLRHSEPPQAKAKNPSSARGIQSLCGNYDLRRFCSAALQGGTLDSSTYPLEGRRYISRSKIATLHRLFHPLILAIRKSVSVSPFCFHTHPNCFSRKPFPLTSIQIAGGVPPCHPPATPSPAESTQEDSYILARTPEAKQTFQQHAGANDK